jgi:hypothetical protein
MADNESESLVRDLSLYYLHWTDLSGSFPVP